MRIVPVLSERSVPREGLDHEKAHAWPKQALRAARQCRRASLPEVREPIELASILEDECFTGADLRVYLDDRPSGGRALDDAASGADRAGRSHRLRSRSRRRLERRGAKHARGAWGSPPSDGRTRSASGDCRIRWSDPPPARLRRYVDTTEASKPISLPHRASTTRSFRRSLESGGVVMVNSAPERVQLV